MDIFGQEYSRSCGKQYYQRFPHRVGQGVVAGVMYMGMMLCVLVVPIFIASFFVDDERLLTSWYWLAVKWLAVPVFIWGFIYGWFITVSEYNKAADKNNPKP